MADNPENLVLQILRELRNEITALHRRVDEGFLQVNLRLNAIEQQLLAQDTRAVAYHERITTLERRLSHVEQRLELEG